MFAFAVSKRKTSRLLVYSLLILAASLFVSSNALAQCTPGPTNNTLTLCSPSDGTTVTSPIHVSAAATSSAPISEFDVYLDNVLVHQQAGGNALDAMVTAGTGNHYLVVKYFNGSWVTAEQNIAVTPNNGGVSVRIDHSTATMATEGTQQFTAAVSGASDSSVTWSVDGEAGGDSTVGTVTPSGTYTAPSTPGAHTVTATSVADPSQSSVAKIEVLPAASCGGGTNNTLSICSPAAGSTVTSPIHVVATANSTAAVGKFVIYLDSVLVYQTSGTKNIDTTISAATGKHNLVLQYYNGAWVKAAENITVSGSTGGGCSGPNNTLSICSPANGATVSSPFTVSAVANSTATVGKFIVYLDGVLVYQQTGSKTLNTSLTAANGSHNLALQFYNGAWVKASETINVGGSSGGVSVSINPTAATVSTGGTQQFSASVSGSSDTSVAWSVDGVQGGSSSVGTINSSGTYVAPGTAGNHTVTATSNADNTKSASASVSVITNSSCGSGANNTISICSPTNGASVPSPIHVVASANSTAAVTKFVVYIDSVLVYQQANTKSIDTMISAAKGTHNLVVQYYNGAWVKGSETITVTTGSGGGGGTVAVLTFHNNVARLGANTSETILTPSNVNTSSFGKVASYPVDGQVYPQPLIVPNLGIAGGTHNVLYVATEHDSVYAFDADGGGKLWSKSLLGPGMTSVPTHDVEGVSPEIGVLSTPVINQGTGTMYLVAHVRNNGATQFWLHALDILTGNEKFGGPVRIQATVNGTGAGSSGGKLSLSPSCYQRTGLAMANGNIYVGFGHCGHGWIIAYNAGTLHQVAVFNSSPNGKGAAIWMAGGAPAVDAAGNIYVENGVDVDSTVNSGYSDAFMKLGPSLAVLDFFMPSNNAFLTKNDADIGSGAPIVMPDNGSAHPHELIGAGKDGRIFVIDRDNMGGFNSTKNNVIQIVQSGVKQFDNFFDTPAFWNGFVYYHAEGDVLRQFSWSNGMLSDSPVARGTIVYGTHGATPSVSSNGGSAGIVWDVDTGGQPSNPAVLHAYEASNIGTELYSSNQNASRDAAGPAVKFAVPTIANGKVYLGAGHQVDIYGLLQ